MLSYDYNGKAANHKIIGRKFFPDVFILHLPLNIQDQDLMIGTAELRSMIPVTNDR